MLDPWKKSYGHPRQHIKKQRHYSADKHLYSQSYGFSSSHEWMWGLDYKENWAPKSWWFWTMFWRRLVECKEIHPVNPKQNLSWIFIGRTNSLATWCEELSHWIRPWCWERFKAGGEGDDRGWDIWTASPSQWTWVWASSRSSQWTRKPGVLQYMGSHRVRHFEQLNWTELSMWQCLCLAGSKIRRWTFAPSESFSNKEQ